MNPTRRFRRGPCGSRSWPRHLLGCSRQKRTVRRGEVAHRSGQVDTASRSAHAGQEDAVPRDDLTPPEELTATDDLTPRLRAICDLSISSVREYAGRHEYDGRVQD